jgi:hypothetical protein
MKKIWQMVSSTIENDVINPMLSMFNGKKLILFHIGRSGSTVLADLLNQHPDIFWDGEVYEPLFRSINSLSAASEHQQLPADPVKFVKKRLKQSGRNYYGFEVKFFHLKLLDVLLDEYIDGLSRLGFTRFVVLKRRNFLRKIVSSAIAHEVKQYHIKNLEDVKQHQVYLNVNQIQIDRDSKPLVSYLHDYEKDFTLLEHILAPKQALHLSYEDDVLPDPKIGYRRVCDFLNIERQDVQVHFARTNPYELRELIENYADVERELRGTTFEWMLYD